MSKFKSKIHYSKKEHINRPPASSPFGGRSVWSPIKVLTLIKKQTHSNLHLGKFKIYQSNKITHLTTVVSLLFGEACEFGRLYLTQSETAVEVQSLLRASWCGFKVKVINELAQIGTTELQASSNFSHSQRLVLQSKITLKNKKIMSWRQRVGMIPATNKSPANGT